MKLILASGSPRRAEILRNAGFDFEVYPADVDESIQPGESTERYVRRLAEEKARAAAQGLAAKLGGRSGIVIAADTVVVIEGEILGKPASPEDAGVMLRRLSSRAHEVLTGLAVMPLPGPDIHVAVESTRVTFARLTDREIEEYIASGEPFGKAGAYAIQSQGGKFITCIEGCYFNVVGLPLARLYAILREIQQKHE